MSKESRQQSGTNYWIFSNFELS